MRKRRLRSFGMLPGRVLWTAAGMLCLHIAGGMAMAGALEWNLSDVIYGSGGMATGSFVYNTDLGRYTDWSVSVTASTPFTAFLYTPATSTAQPCCDDAIQLISKDGSRVFDLFFTSAADSADSPQSAGGSERMNNVPRFTTLDGNAEIVLAVPGPVPEPGSMGLLALGGFVVAALRRLRSTIKSKP